MITTFFIMYGYYTTAVRSLFPDLCLLFVTKCAHLRTVFRECCLQLAVCQHTLLIDVYGQGMHMLPEPKRL